MLHQNEEILTILILYKMKNEVIFIQDLKEGQAFKFKNSPLKYVYGRLSNGYNYYTCLNNGNSYESSRMNVKVELI